MVVRSYYLAAGGDRPVAGSPSGRTRRCILGSAAVVPAVAASVACGASGENQPAAKSTAPATLLMVTDRTGTNLDAQKALFARFTQEQPHVSFEFSPNPPGQSARDRVKIMHQGGTPPDFWESTRAAFGDMLLAGAVAHLTDYVRRDKIPFEKMFVPDHVDHITVQGKIYGWPVVISADALAYNKELFDARGLPHPPTDPNDKAWTMEKFLDVAQKLTKNDGQQFGFGGARSGFARLTDGTNWGQPPWDGKAKCLFDSALWQQAEQFWTDCLFKWHIQPTSAERPSLAPPSGPFFFNGKTGMDVVFGLPPANVGYRWGLATVPFSGKGKNVAGRLGLHSLHMGQGTHKDVVWDVLKWFRKKEYAGAYPMTWGSPVSPLLDGGSDLAQSEYQRRFGVDPKAFLLTALHAKRSGWGLQSLVKFTDYDPQIEKLYNDMFAAKISVGEYVRQATPIVNQMIDESQKILPITGSKV
ncbi:MAG: extracellular solute-binding protein [Chloroflexi bacterium]|nr:extracellular solute-binding protein [Chloroflexota bacterium]